MTYFTKIIMTLVAGFALCLPIAAQAPELAMLDGLRKGAWELRVRQDNSRQRLCVRDGRELIQIGHPQENCERFVVEDGPNEVTVQYTCRDNGYGRTTIRREGTGLVQIRTQGIRNGLPFSRSGEGRFVGAC